MRLLYWLSAAPRTLALALGLFALAGGGAAQEATPAGDLVRVYLDCSGCDSEYIRTEITFVDYVRDRTAADVHLLITFQSTGGGGRSYTLNFIGRGRFQAVDDTLTYVSSGDATSDLIRQGLTRTIKLGLVRFAALTSVAGRLDVQVAAASATAAPAAPARDPWNFWVFRARTNGFLDGESSRDYLNLSLELSADRTTPLWKTSLSVNGNYREGNFQVDDTTRIKDLNRSYSINGLLVRSIGPQLSAGLEASAATTTFGNQELVARVAPAIEYNLFPYSESTRRQFTFTYSAGVNTYDYREITIFGRTEETHPAHSLTGAYSTRQPWGSTSLVLNGSQFMHDFQKYRVVLSGEMNLRVFRGFTVNGGGSYGRIRDQLSLPAADATPEQILLRQRLVGTNYRYFVFFGVGYNFGSLFSPVVNPRLRNLNSEFF